MLKVAFLLIVRILLLGESIVDADLALNIESRNDIIEAFEFGIKVLNEPDHVKAIKKIPDTFRIIMIPNGKTYCTYVSS